MPKIKEKFENLTKEALYLLSGLGIIYSFMTISLFNMFETGLFIFENAVKKELILFPHIGSFFWLMFISLLFLIASYSSSSIGKNMKKPSKGLLDVSLFFIYLSIIFFIIWLFTLCLNTGDMIVSWVDAMGMTIVIS